MNLERNILANGEREPGTWSSWVGVVALLYLLLLGVGVIGTGFQWMSGGADTTAQIFAFATNPIVGVIIGTLATALVQSSSTVTSIIVALVAGGLPVSVAVPIVMGANMGTTITNTIVSLGHIGERAAFRRSFAAATVHDFFNLFCILIFLPLEVFFHPLERIAGVLAGLFSGGSSASISHYNFVGQATKPIVMKMTSAFESLPDTIAPAAFIILGVAMVFVAVLVMGKMLRRVMKGRAKHILNASLGRGTFSGIISGAIVTILVQSSSTTTSLLIPFAGAGILKLKQIYNFTLGANIGTTVTALLAATAVTGGYATLALQIALVHFLYNFLGVILFTLVPGFYNLPMISAERLGNLTLRSRSYAFGYIVAVFILIPGSVFFVQSIFKHSEPQVVEAGQDSPQSKTPTIKVD